MEDELKGWTWDYEVDSVWDKGVLDTKLDALGEGLAHVKTENEINDFQTESFVIAKTRTTMMPSFDIDNIVERFEDWYYDVLGGHFPDEYLFDGVSNTTLNELENKLNEVFFKWCNKHNVKPETFQVNNIEHYTIEEAKTAIKELKEEQND